MIVRSPERANGYFDVGVIRTVCCDQQPTAQTSAQQTHDLTERVRWKVSHRFVFRKRYDVPIGRMQKSQENAFQIVISILAACRFD